MSKLLRLMIAACLLAAAGGGLATLPRPANAQGTNLLTDGNFEAGAPWPLQDGIGEVQVAPGWRAWYLTSPPAFVQAPSNCSETPNRTDCYWMRPEFRDSISADFTNRVHSGLRSQKYFSFGRMHQAGLYQRVAGVTPGMVLRFSIYMQAWMCHEPDKCGKYGEYSDAPSDMHLRVGIDPYGGSDPFGPNVIWSGEMDAFDHWVEFSAQATAQAYAVTVFTHSRADWDWARQDNDVYLDDASLVQVGGDGYTGVQPTNPPAASTTMPTAGPSGTPPPTRTPYVTATALPDGTLTHLVQAGDTLYSIAQQYNVPLDELYRLNNLNAASFLYIGQSLVIRSGQAGETATSIPNTPTPTPTIVAPTETPTTPPQPTDSMTATATQPATSLPKPTQPATRLPESTEMVGQNGSASGLTAGLVGIGLLVVLVGVGVAVMRRRRA